MKCVQDFDNFIYEEKNETDKDRNNEMLPLDFGKKDDVLIKRKDFDLMLADLERVDRYFLLILKELDNKDKTIHRKDAVYKDEYDRLNKAYKKLKQYSLQFK